MILAVYQEMMMSWSDFLWFNSASVLLVSYIALILLVGRQQDIVL